MENHKPKPVQGNFFGQLKVYPSSANKLRRRRLVEILRRTAQLGRDLTPRPVGPKRKKQEGPNQPLLLDVEKQKKSASRKGTPSKPSQMHQLAELKAELANAERIIQSGLLHWQEAKEYENEMANLRREIIRMENLLRKKD